MNKSYRILCILFVLLMVCITGCNKVQERDVPILKGIETPPEATIPSESLTPTETPEPTRVNEVTSIGEPTPIKEPTSTNVPTPTEMPESKPTKEPTPTKEISNHSEQKDQDTVEDYVMIRGNTYPLDVTELDLAGIGLTSDEIGELYKFTELQHLDLSWNSIHDISVLSELTNLTSLSLFRNSDISALSELTNLTSLGLGWNCFRWRNDGKRICRSKLL